MCVLLTILLVLAGGAAAAEESRRYTYTFDAPTLSVRGGVTDVLLAGAETIAGPGLPLLPVAYAYLAVPRGRRVVSVEVATQDEHAVPGMHVVRHAGWPRRFSDTAPAQTARPDPAVYASDACYPAAVAELVSMQSKHGRRIAIVALRPVRYRPRSGRVTYVHTMTVTLSLAAGGQTAGRAPVAGEREPWDRREISKLVDNPGEMQLGEAVPAPGSTVLTGADFMHVVIAPQSLLDAPAPYNLQALCAARTASGMTSTNVSLEWIYANYDGSTPAGGEDDPTRIRTFIADAYATWGTRYAVLVGTHTLLPVRYLYCKSELDTGTLPADMYYGCLDGTFNEDGDGLYGEPKDGPGDTDIDTLAEVCVGRLPVANTTEVARVVQKILAHDTAPPSTQRKVMMLGEYLGAPSYYYSKPRMEQVRLGGTYDGYETQGFENGTYRNVFDTSENLYDQDAAWSKSTLLDHMNAGVHVFNHLGHGVTAGCMRLTTGDLPGLTNARYFIAYSQACDCGRIDTADSFAETLMTVSGGAVAVVMNARVGYYGTGTDGSSQRCNRWFWDSALRYNLHRIGLIHFHCKARMAGLIAMYGGIRWCTYGLNLLGDPASYFINPNADHDGDGMASGAEEEAGTDPGDDTSLLAVEEARQTETLEGDGFVLSWQAVEGRTYNLYECSRLDTGEWVCAHGFSNLPGVAGTMSCTVAVDTVEQRFYRVGVTAP
jgi:hypothetical protein